MKKLFHLSTTNKYLEWFQDDWERIQTFVDKHHLDGIELGLTDDYDITRIPQGIVEGVHLKFYPMWLEFWKGDLAQTEALLGSREAVQDYYGGFDREVLVEAYKSQFEKAKAIGAKYMVFHVCHIRMEDSFTWTFDYTDEEVMDATLELVNEVFQGDGPALLFENLWWPGLTYTKPDLAKAFIERVDYANKGYLVDTSHLILTNPGLGRERECYTYIKKIIDDLGDTAKWIKGVHLNKTLPKNYMRQNHAYTLEKFQKAPNTKMKQNVLRQHIQKLDPHLPFDTPEAQMILDVIKPQFCVYETNPSSVYELAHFIKRQNQALGVTY
ncbi:MAG: TIM barrel protein [Cellulosilyticaceae bacterium]